VTEGIITNRHARQHHGYVNDAALKMLGFSVKQELIGKNASRLMAEEESFGVIPEVDECRGANANKGFLNVRLMKKDGRTFDAELNAASVRDAVGNFNGFRNQCQRYYRT